MASADYSVGTKVTADVSNFEKGMNKAEKSLKGFSDKLANSIDRLGKKGLVGSIANVTLAMQGLTKSFNTVIKFAQDVGKAINECTEAYKGQVIAERALNTAIQNNPFVTGASSKALKEFASEMQRVSNYGDEELIPMMANLISLGRTESETMQIMSVAMDMSAGMGISLDTAITQLNATLNGNIGRLGQQNAELKNLTDEELRQGKAVEILGEKFKGFSKASADTSKQLQNIKGDFKEALGQFTLPSSDMWNKFWTGFYEKGIAIINKFNDYLDVNIIGKQIVENLYSNARTVAKANKQKVDDVLSDFGYIEEQLSYLSDSELVTLQKTLEAQKERTQGEERILISVKTILHNKELQADRDRKDAELLAKKAKDAELLANKEKEIADAKAKQLKVEEEWTDKLFAIRLENLEATREKELENEKLTQEEREAIVDFYGNQILVMKIKQIEKEREEALKQENLTEEAKRAINLYYENRITNAKKDEEEKRLKTKKKTDKEEEKEEKNKFATMIEYAKQYTKKIAETFKNVAKKIASTVKNVISTVGNIFTKIFEFNPNEALDNLLKFEDKVLTFFVETLPKLPNFFASAVQSIVTLIDTLMNIIDWNEILNIINSIVNVIVKNAPTIVKNLLIVAQNIIETLLKGLIDFVNSGGWKTLLDLFLTIQKTVEQIVIDNMDDLVDTIIKMLPDLIETLKNSIVSASRTLGKLAPKLLPMIAELINAIVEVITSNEVIDSANEAVEGIVEGLVEAIIKLLPNAIMKILNMAIKLANPQRVSKLAIAIVKGLIKAFAKINWLDVVKECFMGFIDGIKELFGINSPSKLFEEFGTYMIQGLWNGIKNMGSWLWNNVSFFFSNIVSGIKNCFSGIGDWFKDVFSSAWEGIKNIWGNVVDWFKDIANKIGDAIKDGMERAGNFIKDSFTGDNTAGRVGLGILTGGLSELPHAFGWWANGTQSAPAGLSVVGEAGPELVRFRGGEQVINNRNTQKLLSGANGNTNNFNVTFNNLQDTSAFAMMNQFKQYNRQMAINGII